MKNALVCTLCGYILYLGLTEPGAVHDISICWGLVFPKQTQLLCDLGFVGYHAENATVLRPHKKPKGGTLTPEQKAENREFAKRRIVVEHVFNDLKRFKILTGKFPMRRLDSADLTIQIVAALYNFKLDFNNHYLDH